MLTLAMSPRGGQPDPDLEYVRTLKGVFRDAEERERYLRDNWTRIQIVLDLIRGLRRLGAGRVLELGANPYLLTSLIRRHLGVDLELANYFESFSDEEATHVADLSGEPVEFRFRHFNVEVDPFPYPDACFDAVLFCEILEHLVLSPDHVLEEIARVLRPGGVVLISTPNAVRLTKLYFMALGRNVYDGYSSNGVYGRHNREFTLSEVRDLVERHGLSVERFEMRNVQPLARRFTWLQRLRPTVWPEHIFLLAQRPA